jgi:uncharacterized protein (TIGR03435 family)
MRPDLQASTIFPCAGPVPAPPKPAITATAPGPAAPDTPGTMGEAATRPAERPTPPARPLFNALQEQLGLRLAPAEQTLARLFVVDRVAQRPTEN